MAINFCKSLDSVVVISGKLIISVDFISDLSMMVLLLFLLI